MITLANNWTIKPYGVTKFLEVNVEGFIIHHKFVVLDHRDHDILLGNDFLQISGALVCQKERYIKFPSIVVYGKASEDVENNFAMVGNTMVEDEFELFEMHDFESQYSIKPKSGLSDEEFQNFKKLNSAVNQVAASSFEELGDCTMGNMCIETTTDVPIYLHPYRRSAADNLRIEEMIKKLLEAKIIIPSHSAWSFPLLTIPKPNGDIRLAIDYRRLNAITKIRRWPMKLVLDILDKLKGSNWFTSLDLFSGYYQIRMDVASQKYTAFSSATGHYEFCKVPFGLKNAPSEFSFIMHTVLGDIPFVEVYLDDIFIHTCGELIDHIKQVAEVLKRLWKVNLKINPAKCIWMAKEIKVLGHIVSKDTVTMDPQKVSAIVNRPIPINVKEVQSFLGLANYYRRFIKDFSKTVAPMYALCKKDAKFVWSEDCRIAFKAIVKACSEFPILQLPDLNRAFIIYTDASGYAMGAILAQLDESGVEHVCAYASRLFKGAEIRYTVTEKECLAVVFAVREFRIYIGENQCTVFTDHSALVWLFNVEEPSSRLARWAALLSQFDLKFVHVKGKDNVVADSISRPGKSLSNVVKILAVTKNTVNSEKNNARITISNLDPYENSALLHYLSFGRHEPGASSKTCALVKRLATAYRFEMDSIYHIEPTGVDCKVPRRSERVELIDKAHRLGHFQAKTTFDNLRKEYYWPKMFKDVEYFVARCIPCQHHQKSKSWSHPAISIQVAQFNDVVHIDLIMGLDESNGFVGIFVAYERLSHYPVAVPIRSKTMEEIARVLFDYYISVFGPPKTIVSDRGNEFVNSVVAALLKLHGIDHVVTSAYNPKANGIVERFNQTLCETLRKCTNENPSLWHLHIPFALFAYRTRIIRKRVRHR